ncbi:hypothetical protein G7Y89_g686 [Cudoniella acicularis]|uniref:Uncharacterized protein n=1 Tax=Cudoniella acicularis TaxID=354080 RepID=A0A8H4RWN8_9HELO|nr:hypothetical protein G7Y89_g686 [Cudoniella acicularis]
MKFLDKVWGPTGSRPPPTDDLTPPRKDIIFAFQILQPNPLALIPLSLKIAKITGTDQYSNSVFRSAQKEGIISQEGYPVTSKINANLVNRIAILSLPKTKELVNLLFFWEEESTRLRMLQEEEQEIDVILQEMDGVDGERQSHERMELELRLAQVKIRRAMVPSKRTAGGLARGEEELPGYEA